jgi:hypothetical protein
MPEFTKDVLNNARIEGYTNDEIIAHVTKNRPDILNALEEGYSLDEIADHFGKNASPKPEAEKQEDPSIGRVAAGLAAEIAVAEGAKYGGAAIGAGIGASPVITAPVTAPTGAFIGYVTGALGGGWTGSILAQKIEGEKEINYGRATIDTLLNLIPGVKISKAGSKLLKVSTAFSKRPIRTAMALGAVATPAYMAADEIQDKKDYTLEDYLKATGTSMALGAGLGLAEKRLTNGILKIRNKTPDEINQLITKGDPITIELVDALTAGVIPQDVKMSPASVAEYIQSMTKSGTASIAPSRLVGKDITNIAREASSSVEAVKGTAGNIGKQIDSYLEANPQFKEGAIDFLDGADRADLPPELLEKLVFARNKIRNEQQRMIDLHNSGEKLLPNNRAEVIEASLNRGDYLTRAYEFFQNPNYKPSKEKYDALKKKLRETLDESEANAYLAELNLKMKGNPTDFSTFMQGPGTPSVFKQKKVVSSELEDYLGLITNPGQRVESTMSVLNRINEYNEADARIAKILLDSGMAVKASDPSFAQGLQPLNLKRGEAIVDGEKLFVDPNIQTALNKIYAGGIDQESNSVTKRVIADIYDTAVSAFKSSKVLGNLPSYLIQIPSNIAGTLGTGMNPILGLGNATKMALGTLSGTKLGSLPVIRKFANEAPPLTLQKFEDLKKRGMITGNIAYDDIKAGLQGKRLGKAFEKATDTPGRIYSIPDNIFRVVNYENNMLVLSRMMPTATEEQLKDMAARLTTRTYPNYESISPEIKALSRAGVMPQFVTYTAEFARTQLEQAKVILEIANGSLASKLGSEFKDIPMNLAAAKKEAAKRAVAMTTAYAAASYGLNSFNRESLTEEQERAFRDTVVPDYERDKPIFIKKNKDNSYTTVNTAYYLPQTILANPVMSILRGENPEEATSNVFSILGKELVGEGSFAAQAMNTFVSGRDRETGKLISNDPTLIGNLTDRAKNFGEELVPSTITALQRPDKTAEEKLTKQAGLRSEKREVPEGFGFKARAINEAISNISSTISGKKYALEAKRISPEEYQSALADEQKNYLGNMEIMVNHVNNLKTLGETDDTIIPMLKDAKFSSIDALNLIEGKAVPFNPTKEKTTSEVLDELTGANDQETQQNIRNFTTQDPILGKKVVNAYVDRKRTEGIVLSPKESLIAGLPTTEKVERLFPEIQSSRDPESEIRRLFKKKILTEIDVKAIKIRQNLK